MRTTTKQLKANLFTFFLLISFMSFSQSMATYTITFTGNWNSTDHSDNGMIPLPSNDHWSDLVGSTHNSSVTFWEAGQMASIGIEDVAERGNNDEFFDEVDAAISAGKANQWIQQQFVPNNAMGMSTIMSITVSEDFPLLTLVSMIAPSPDWFVGINGYSLLDGSNNWKDNILIDMFPYDAGTEDGMDYDTDNASSNPQQNIFSLINVAPFNDKKIGTLSINLESVLNIPTSDFKTGIKLSPNPTHGKVMVNNTTNESIDTIEVVDVIGKLVKKIQLNTTYKEAIINLKDLNTGIYLVKIVSSKGNLSLKKLIIK